MALRWRIRHKLMLGLGLVVGIMALLLFGTLHGLYGFYLTAHSIRAKMMELRAAENVKEVVARLVAPHNVDGLLENPAQRLNGPPLNHNLTNIDTVKAKLKDYESQLQVTQLQNSDSEKGENDLADRVKDLRENLARFEKAILAVATPPAPDKPEPDARESLRKEGASLTQNATDLRDRIYEQLLAHLGECRRHYQLTLWFVLPSSIVGLLLMVGLTRSFYAWVFYPIRDLETGVNRVARGDFDHHIDVHSGDEMEDLGAAFNDMLRRLHDLYSDLARQVNERSRQLVRSERLASVGFLAAGVAHEINNPLASILFCSETLEGRLGELLRSLQVPGRTSPDLEVFRKYLKMIQEESVRCKSITERLLAFSRTGELRRDATDLGQLVQSVLDITQHLQNCRGKQIVFEKPARDEGQGRGKIVAPVNGDEIKSVVLNLVVNALDSMEEGGKLTIQMAQKDGMAELRFTDTGCGMSQEVLENIFEPFFTRSRTGKGTGLGLTISHRIVNQHGGEIEATSAGPNQGSTFIVRLPLHFEEPANPPPVEGRTTERSTGADPVRQAA